MSDQPEDPDQLQESSREAIGKLRSLVDDLKAVEEHQHNILGDEDEPPLFIPDPA